MIGKEPGSGIGKEHPGAARFARHVNPSFVKLLGVFAYGRVIVRGEGAKLWDDQGRVYDDFLSGFGATNLGHNPPRLIAAIAEHFAAQPVNLVHVGPQVHAGDLAEALAARAAPLTMSCFASSGGEAVEIAMKIARAFTGRAGFLHCEGGFHGTGFGNLSVMGHTRLRKPFEPLLAGCDAVPFGDVDALTKALAKKRHAAFLVEPIQGEAGVVVPPPGYLREAKRLCEKFGALLIFDEVQTGLGRTGALFAYGHEHVVPDLLVLGKALGGGLLPISATLTTEEIHGRVFGSMDTFDLCSSTFAGNALACRAALETLRTIDDEGLVEAARTKGDRLRNTLSARLAGHPLVREVRGRGLLVGVALGPTGAGLVQKLAPALVRGVAKNVLGQWLAVRLLERGFVCQPASQAWDVLKVEPPLTIADEAIDRFVDAVAELLNGYRDVATVLRDAGERIGKQAFSGWGFG
jgi:putrescine aminotransferase